MTMDNKQATEALCNIKNWNKLKMAQINDHEIYGAFTGYDFSKMIFNNCRFDTAILEGCNFNGTIFDNCIFNNNEHKKYSTIFAMSDLSNTTFKNCLLSNVSFRSCDLNNMALIDTTLLRTIKQVKCFNVGNVFNGKNSTQIYRLFDYRGYVTIYDYSIKTFYSGCRVYNQQQALNHWGDKEYSNSELGKEYIKFIEKWSK